MTRLGIRALLLILVLWGTVGLLFAQNAPMKLRLRTDDGARVEIPVISRGYYTLRWKTKEGDDWNYERAENTFKKKLPAVGEYDFELGPENIRRVDYSPSSASKAAVQLLEIAAWGDVVWDNMREVFAGCRNMEISATDLPNMSFVHDCEGMFSGCSTMNSPNLSGWNMSTVRNISGMFAGCTNFNQPLDRWDVSHVEKMDGLFVQANAFDQPLGTWELRVCSRLALPIMSEENYVTTLQQWANKTGMVEGLKLYAPFRSYAKCTEARTKLIEERKWEITGDYERLGSPKGTNPFIFKIKAQATRVYLPLFGKDFSFTYQKEGGSPVAVNNVTSIPLPSFEAEKGATYTISVAPQGLGAFGMRLEAVSPDLLGIEITEILRFGDVQWASTARFLRNFTGHIAADAGSPDLSIVKDAAGMCEEMGENTGIDVSTWNVANIEDFSDLFSYSSEKGVDISTWKLYACKKLDLSNSLLSPEMYEKALKAWSEDPKTKTGVRLKAEGLIYPATANVYRQKLVTEKGWVIEGDELPDFISLSKKEQKPLYQGATHEYRIAFGKNITTLEINNLVFTSEPVDALTCEVKTDGVEYFLSVKANQSGKVTIKATLPQTAAHGTVEVAYPITVLETPTTIKVYDMTGNEIADRVTIKEGTLTRFRAEVQPKEIQDWAFDIQPVVVFTALGNELTLDTDATPGTYTVSVSVEGVAQLKKTFQLKIEPVLRVKLSQENPLELILNREEEKKKFQVVAQVLPAASAASQNVVCSIEGTDRQVISISSEGLITALKPGTQLVKVTAKDNPEAIPAFLPVTVDYSLDQIAILKDGQEVTEYTIDLSEAVMNPNDGSFVLKAKYTPEEILNREVDWEISDEYFRREDLSPEEVRLTPLKKGTSTVKLTYRANPNQDATLRVTIEHNAKGLKIFHENTECTGAQFLLWESLSNVVFQVKALPAGADLPTDLVWTSDNPKFTVVGGTVTPTATAAAGDQATITVKSTAQPTLAASFTVKMVSEVVPAATAVTLPVTMFEKFLNDSFDIGVSVSPATAQQFVAWEYEPKDQKVLEITPTGTVKIFQLGIVKVRAVTSNGKYSAWATIRGCNRLTAIRFVNPPTELYDRTEKGKVLQLGFTPDAQYPSYTVTFDPPEALELIRTPASFLYVVKVKNAKKGDKVTIRLSVPAQPELAAATCEVRIVEYIDLKGLSVAHADQELLMLVNERKTPNITFQPADATNKKLSWNSSNPSVADYDLTTKEIVAKSLGTATLTATSEEGGYKAIFQVKVLKEKKDPESVTLTPTSLPTLWVDKAFNLTATVNPAEASQVVQWVFTPADQDVVTLSSEGVGKALKPGVVKVKARTQNGKESEELEIRVLAKLASLTFQEPATEVFVGKETKFTLAFTPDTDVDKSCDISFTPTEYIEKVALENGVLTVKGIKPLATGKVTISVKSTLYSDLPPATCEVEVKGTNHVDVPIVVESISLPSTATVEVGKDTTLLVTFKPENPTDKTLTWTSSDPTIATVTDGVVKGVAVGTATITATSVNNKPASCTVTVTPPTSVDETVFAEVMVVPNPFTTHLRVVNPTGVQMRYTLVNLSGIALRSGVVTDTEFLIDTSTLPAGAYFVRLEAQGGAQKTVMVSK